MDLYLRFRLSLARHGLARVSASLRSSLEITVLACGPLVLGLIAAAALPPVLSATRPLAQALPLILLHGLAMTLPAWLLRALVLPEEALAMLHALPVPRRARLQADALIAALLTAPLALAYATSLAILLWQQPAWMHGVYGVAATLVSCLLTWLGALSVLAWRGRRMPARAGRTERDGIVEAYAAPGMRWPAVLLWQHLFWASSWRGARATGPRQTLLLAASCISAYCWMHPAIVPPALLGLATSTLLMLLAHLGDQAVRAQIVMLRPLLAGWPMKLGRFEMQVRALTLAPSLVACLALALSGMPSGAWSHLAGRLYLTLAVLAPMLLIAVPAISPRARVAQVAGAILILTAVGSEL